MLFRHIVGEVTQQQSCIQRSRVRRFAVGPALDRMRAMHHRKADAAAGRFG